MLSSDYPSSKLGHFPLFTRMPQSQTPRSDSQSHGMSKLTMMIPWRTWVLVRGYPICSGKLSESLKRLSHPLRYWPLFENEPGFTTFAASLSPNAAAHCSSIQSIASQSQQRQLRRSPCLKSCSVPRQSIDQSRSSHWSKDVVHHVRHDGSIAWFITYLIIRFWLPFILKHSYVALNFLPQASYEHAAPLDIEPKPDVVIRVFMLFKRVCEDELDEWEGALSRASEDAELWKGIVGVDTERMKDEKLFRVLEWGGMEVNYWSVVEF